MSTTVAIPQPQTGKSSIRQQFKLTASKAETQTQKQTKEKQATIAVLKKFLEADSQLYGNTVTAILAYAKNVFEARDELKGNGIPELHFDPWTDFKNQCKGGKSSVSKFISIAEHKPINDAKNLKYLPASASTLYELSNMSVDEFNQVPKSVTEKDGTINPAMTRDQARTIAGKKPHPKGTWKVEEPVESKLERSRTRTTLAEAEAEDHLDAAMALTTVKARAESKEKTITFQLVMSLADYEANEDEVTHLKDHFITKVTTLKHLLPSLRLIELAD